MTKKNKIVELEYCEIKLFKKTKEQNKKEKMKALIFAPNEVIGKKIAELFMYILTNGLSLSYDFSGVLETIFVKNKKDLWLAISFFNVDLIIIYKDPFGFKREREELGVKIKQKHPRMIVLLINLGYEKVVNKKGLDTVSEGYFLNN